MPPKSVQVARPAGRYFKGKPGAALQAHSSDSDSDADDTEVDAQRARLHGREGREMGVSLGKAVGVDSQGRVVGIRQEGAFWFSLSSPPPSFPLRDSSLVVAASPLIPYRRSELTHIDALLLCCRVLV